MSYQRISDGVNTFDNSTSQEKHDIPMQMPVSFIRCPVCKSDKLGYMCDCIPENYICDKCGWTYITHEHEQNLASRVGENVNMRSVLAGAIRN